MYHRPIHEVYQLFLDEVRSFLHSFLLQYRDRDFFGNFFFFWKLNFLHLFFYFFSLIRRKWQNWQGSLVQLMQSLEENSLFMMDFLLVSFLNFNPNFIFFLFFSYLFFFWGFIVYLSSFWLFFVFVCVCVCVCCLSSWCEEKWMKWRVKCL